MERLRRRDLLLLHTAIGEIYEIDRNDTFPKNILSLLRRLVAADYSSYNQFDHRYRPYILQYDSDDPSHFEGISSFTRYRRQHPFINQPAHFKNGDVHKLSDFLTRPQYHRLEIYNEFYRKRKVEYQILFRLPVEPRDNYLFLVLNRERRDFSERDRQILTLFLPHLTRVYQTGKMLGRLRAERNLLEKGITQEGRGIVHLDPSGRATSISPVARRWLIEFLDLPFQRMEFPPSLATWVKERLGSPLFQRDNHPLIFEKGKRRLIIQLLCESGRGGAILLLKEKKDPSLGDSPLQSSFGLSTREVEVVHWMAQGKSNIEIGMILGVSAGTVKTHAERLYRKLGVQSRAAAVAQASCILGGGGSPSDE